MENFKQRLVEELTKPTPSLAIETDEVAKMLSDKNAKGYIKSQGGIKMRILQHAKSAKAELYGEPCRAHYFRDFTTGRLYKLYVRGDEFYDSVTHKWQSFHGPKKVTTLVLNQKR